MDNTQTFSDADMLEFQRTFFEEAEEHLNSMESLLVDLNPEAWEDETMNAIFRAAHSIKGGSATFGFTEIAELTHVAENLLDQVRNHTLDITSEMVDVLLQTGDAVRLQVQCRRENKIDESPDVESLKQRLQQLGARANEQSVIVQPREMLTTPLSQVNTQTPIQPQTQPVLPAQRTQTDTTQYRISARLPAQGISQVVRDSLFGDLLMLGTLNEDPEGEPVGMMRFLFNTNAEPAELCKLMDFLLGIQGSIVERYPSEGQSQVKVDQGYGLFDGAAGSPQAAAYGLFSEEAIKSKQTTEEVGYGFFVPVGAQQENKVAENKDLGYGFFTPIENPALEKVTPQLPQTEQASTIPSTKVVESNKTISKKPVEEASIRVSVEKVDQMINLVGELVITQAVLMQNSARLDPGQHQQLFAGFADLERHTRDLQESVMSIRMLPIANVFNRFPRMLRDLATKLGKKVELKTLGEGTDLDKGLIERITDPMTHLVRNALDHGIEMPEVRIAQGKPAHGTITLKAAQRGGNIVVEVNDDGGGLHREKIIAKAREKGLPIAEDASDSEVWNLIFAPGFSTAEQITDVSGRGVGMDVVKRNIIDLGGNVEISSVAGQGTSIVIKLPLTLAIMDGMSIAIGGEIYVLPLASVIESIPLKESDLRSIAEHGQVIEVRQEYLPVLDLREVFHIQRHVQAQDISVVVEADGMKAALLVDELVGQQQVVVKNLESNYRKVPGVSGATIMGDGSVALILDVVALVKRSRH